MTAPTRRALTLGALAACLPAPARAADDPASTVREAIRRAQRGDGLAAQIAAQDAAASFTADLLARLGGADVATLFAAADPLRGAPDAGPPRLLAMRTLRRRRDEARVEAALREPGRARRPWTTHFALRRESGRWRIDDLWIEGAGGTLRDRAGR